MLSVRVQLITWEDRTRNDLLCVEMDVKQLLTHSLTIWASVCCMIWFLLICSVV